MIQYNKLIFLYQKTRCCKYYTLYTTYIKLHMDKKLNEICKKLTCTKLTIRPHNTQSYNAIKHNHTLKLTSLLSTKQCTYILIFTQIN